MLKQPFEAFFKKYAMGNFAEFTRKHLCRNLFFGVFLWILQNLWKHLFCSRAPPDWLWLLAAPIVVKGVLANETVNYDTNALRKKSWNSKSSYYGVNLRIQPKYRKIWTTKNSVFRHFSCSEIKAYVLIWPRSVIY